MQEVIKVEQLTKSYGKLHAVENISLSVDRGMVFGLLGANGAGKSTTIECIPVSYTHLCQRHTNPKPSQAFPIQWLILSMG